MKSPIPHPRWQERTTQLLGEEKMSRLNHAHVLVAGMGGVGSMAAEMICRGGIGRITIVDGDTIQPGNINRQVPAIHSTLGRSKAEVMGERLLDINPGLQLNIVAEYIKDERITAILNGSFDYVVDAIDTLSPKTFLIANAINRGFQLTSSMGSGGKLDPSQIHVADFSDTYNCRLAYLLRKRLRKIGIESGFQVVFSTEQVPSDRILPVEGEPNKKSTVGTSSYIPAIFGCMLASIVIRDLVAIPRE